jgi:hypothetical protein
MAPNTLFDKSFLQSLSVDESVWFDHFLSPVVCPLFFVETLADLSKTSLSGKRTAEAEVRVIADKTPVLTGTPCAHHAQLCISNLLGREIPMNGRIPVAGGKTVRAQSGKTGVVFSAAPEAEAFSRWQREEFGDVERLFATQWRDMLSKLDLPRVAEGMRKLGVSSKSCKTMQQAYDIAEAVIQSREDPFDQAALLFSFVSVPQPVQVAILKRWSIDSYRPLSKFAPFAAHVLKVELFFQIALAANLISTERASNRVDVAYLCYLPFCNIFVSGDKLHRACSEVFLRKDQDFVWGADLKLELGRQNAEFSNKPSAEKEKGLMQFAPSPIETSDGLLVGLWDKHMPGWRNRNDNQINLSAEAERKLVAQLKELKHAPQVGEVEDDELVGGVEEISIERRVPKRKGNWWLLPKDLQDAES